MANGEYVTFPGSHVWLMPGSLQARLDAHDAGWDLVTASVANGNTTRAGWASYLLDHAAQAPSRASGEYQGVPGHASYITRDVLAVGGFPEDMRAGEDTVVNRKLHFAGKRTYFCAEASFAHATPSTGLAHLLRHHFQRGRALGRIIRTDSSRSRRALLRSTKSLPKRRLRHIDTALDAAGDELRGRYRARSAPTSQPGRWPPPPARGTSCSPADPPAPRRASAPGGHGRTAPRHLRPAG